MGAHDFKLYNVPFFARKPVNFNVSRSAVPKLALVPASYYMCDVKLSILKVCAKFHHPTFTLCSRRPRQPRWSET